MFSGPEKNLPTRKSFHNKSKCKVENKPVSSVFIMIIVLRDNNMNMQDIMSTCDLEYDACWHR